MTAATYSRRLGPIAPEQFQAALDRFDLGAFIAAEAIPFGMFGQNIKVTSSAGAFVLRGVAHFDWQFPKERLVASILHEQTAVAAPWPYLLDLDRTVFPWRNGYVLMPYLPGLQLADPEVVAKLTQAERGEIAFALGANLRDIHCAESPFAGHYDHELGAFRPFDEAFGTWTARQISEAVEHYRTRGDARSSDKQWIDAHLAEAQDALAEPFTPVLVHNDYTQANLTVGLEAGRCKVTGVFDLMEALFGDGEYDLVRQIAAYIDRDEQILARRFLSGYQQQAPLRPGALARLGVYLIQDRLIIWDFHHPENNHQWRYGNIGLSEWLEGYLSALGALL